MQVDFVRPKQAAKIFGLSESFIRQAISARLIPSYKLSKATFLKCSEITEMIQSGRRPGREG